jgi:RNA recognition motif-containing protein
MAKELYVGHLSEQTTEEDLRKLFSVMGVVTSIHLIIDPDTREFKRCGYVRMAAGIDPNEVVETLDGAYLIDREIHVSIARPQKPGMGAAAKTLAKKPWLKGGPKPGGKGAAVKAEGQKAGGREQRTKPRSESPAPAGPAGGRRPAGGPGKGRPKK